MKFQFQIGAIKRLDFRFTDLNAYTKFQFQIGAIKSYSYADAIFEASFNSKLVRLKVAQPPMRPALREGFNSKLVRLKAVLHAECHVSSPPL